MPVRNLRHYDEEFDYIELTKQTQRGYSRTTHELHFQLSELLYFLNCFLCVVGRI